MELPSGDGNVGFWAALLGGTVGVATWVWRTLSSETKRDDETRRASAQAIPDLMRDLHAKGTPMPALGGGDAVEAINNLCAALEKSTIEIKGIRQDMHERKIEERAFREGERSRRDAGR